MRPVVPVGKAAAGLSAESFAQFYDHALDLVFGYLLRSMLGNRVIAEDLTQETFAAVAVAARAGRPEALTVPWVMGVARHKLVDHYRRVARDERHLALMWGGSEKCYDLDLPDDTDPPRVLEQLRSLRPEHQLVLILKYVDELSAQEIASVLDRSVQATNSMLSRARQALAGALTVNPS